MNDLTDTDLADLSEILRFGLGAVAGAIVTTTIFIVSVDRDPAPALPEQAQQVTSTVRGGECSE